MILTLTYITTEYIYDKFKDSTRFTTNSNEVIRYIEFCYIFGQRQSIKDPTRITSSTSSLITHILTNSDDKISLSGDISVNVGPSDHQLIYCTRKITRVKLSKHKEITSRFYKECTPELYDEALTNLNFLYYQTFDNVGNAYNGFIDKLAFVIDNIAPVKVTRVKGYTRMV